MIGGRTGARRPRPTEREGQVGRNLVPPFYAQSICGAHDLSAAGRAEFNPAKREPGPTAVPRKADGPGGSGPGWPERCRFNIAGQKIRDQPAPSD